MIICTYQQHSVNMIRTFSVPYLFDIHKYQYPLSADILSVMSNYPSSPAVVPVGMKKEMFICKRIFKKPTLIHPSTVATHSTFLHFHLHLSPGWWWWQWQYVFTTTRFNQYAKIELTKIQPTSNYTLTHLESLIWCVSGNTCCKDVKISFSYPWNLKQQRRRRQYRENKIGENKKKMKMKFYLCC